MQTQNHHLYLDILNLIHMLKCVLNSLRGHVSAFPEYWPGDIFYFIVSNTVTLCNIVFYFRWGNFHFLMLLLIYHPDFASMTISDILCKNPASPHDICSSVWGIVCAPSSAAPAHSCTSPSGSLPHIFQGFSLFKLQATFFFFLF